MIYRETFVFEEVKGTNADQICDYLKVVGGINILILRILLRSLPNNLLKEVLDILDSPTHGVDSIEPLDDSCDKLS